MTTTTTTTTNQVDGESVKDSLGMRMKKYESVSRMVLTPRMPAILRLDGRAFHTFTRGFDYPYDEYLSRCMRAAAITLIQEIPTACLAYGQSDEISILLIDYKSLYSQQWFDGKVQKIASVASSIVTAEFARRMIQHIQMLNNNMLDMTTSEAKERSFNISQKGWRATFDARIFSIPEDDVPNYFYWRWKDATRNSVSMAGRAQFSHKQLMNKGVNDIKNMLRHEANKPWEEMPVYFKDGWAIKREQTKKNSRGAWGVTPIEEDIRSITQQAIKQSKDNPEDDQCQSSLAC